MGCYENKEMRQLRTLFFVMAAVVLAGGIWVILTGQAAVEARFTEAFAELYGKAGMEEFLDYAGSGGYGSVRRFLILSSVVFVVYFLLMTGILSKVCKEIRRFSLCLEQMTAGRTVSLAEWKEGILAALSNQVELLYLRNCHMVELVQEEKETICQFTENMAHQMKTPLTAMRLDLDLMETKLPGLKEELWGQESSERAVGREQAALQKKLEDCLFQCDRLWGSVDEFLTASRMAAGRMRLILRPVLVEGLIKGACAELSAVLEKEEICVDFVSESKQPLYCDCNWMRAAIINLLKNSAESMEGGGAVRVRHWDERGWKYLEFTDEGGGISGEAGRHIFERFYTGRQGKGGTGLGLNIAKEVVEACHGTIEAFPVSGKEGRKDGTCFLMKFRIL